MTSRRTLALATAVAAAAVAAAVLAARPGAGPPAPPPKPVDSHAARAAASQIGALRRTDVPGLDLRAAGADAVRIAASLPDNADPARAKLLGSGLGRGGHSIYAVPTGGGAVCVGLSGVSSGCVPSFPPDLPVDWSVGKPDTLPLGQGEPVALWGIAPDDVVQVQVRVAGELHDAGVERNAFFFEAADNATAAEAFTTLVVTYRGGDTKIVPVW